MTSPLKPDETDTFIPPVTYQFLIDPEPKELNSKCTQCEMVTVHHWVKVNPYNPNFVGDPLETLAMVRRIILCTNCGSMSLKK